MNIQLNLSVNTCTRQLLIILNFTPTTFADHNESRQQGKYISLYRSMR